MEIVLRNSHTSEKTEKTEKTENFRGDVRLKFSGHAYNLRSFILDEFTSFTPFGSFRNQDEFELEDQKIVKTLIRSLYTGTFDPYSLEKNQLIILSEFCKKMNLRNIHQLCLLSLDMVDFREAINRFNA